MKFKRYDGCNGKEIAEFVGSRHCNEIMNAVHPASAKNKILQVYLNPSRAADIRYGDFVVKSNDGIIVVMQHQEFLKAFKDNANAWLNPLGYFIDMTVDSYAKLMYSHKDAHTGKYHTGITVWMDEVESEFKCECICFTDAFSFIRMTSGAMSYRNPHLFTQVDRMNRIRSLVDQDNGS